MSWYKITIDSNQLSSGEMVNIGKKFSDILHALGSPKDMFALCDNMPQKVAGQNKMVTSIYFSPGCMPHISQLIADYSGVSCEEPDRSSLAFMDGDKSCI